jgi:DNA-binding cell septation regulator SpoVG
VSSGTWITGLRFTPAPRADTERGLLGWLAFDIEGTWHVDGVVLRRTREGRLTLAFPTRTDRAGREHAYVRPTCDRARQAIEDAVLAELKVST